MYNKNAYIFVESFYELSMLGILAHLTLPAALKKRPCCDTHFIDEETEA